MVLNSACQETGCCFLLKNSNVRQMNDTATVGFAHQSKKLYLCG